MKNAIIFAVIDSSKVETLREDKTASVARFGEKSQNLVFWSIKMGEKLLPLGIFMKKSGNVSKFKQKFKVFDFGQKNNFQQQK